MCIFTIGLPLFNYVPVHSQHFYPYLSSHKHVFTLRSLNTLPWFVKFSFTLTFFNTSSVIFHATLFSSQPVCSRLNSHFVHTNIHSILDLIPASADAMLSFLPFFFLPFSFAFSCLFVFGVFVFHTHAKTLRSCPSLLCADAGICKTRSSVADILCLPFRRLHLFSLFVFIFPIFHTLALSFLFVLFLFLFL